MGPRYAHHPYHYHHRPYYLGWRPGWWTVPVAWGLGAAWWDWNTPDYAYYNPYAVYVDGGTYNYSNPVYVYTDEELNGEGSAPSSTTSGITTQETDTTTGQAAMQSFQKARNAFKKAEYKDALNDINQAIGKAPKDAALHEFRALTLFATGQYNQAAAVVNSVLASGPGWNWDTMIGLYQDPQQYTKQLRNLESFVKQYPDDAAAHFLLAYHYLVMGYTDNAETQLKRVVQLQPKDVLSKRILDAIEQKTNKASTPERPTPQD